MRNVHLLVLALLVLPLAQCSCSRPPGIPAPDQDDPVRPADGTPAAAAPPAPDAPAADAVADAPPGPREAAAILHAYLSLLPGGDHAAADTFWARGDPGRAPGDAALRARSQPDAMRIDTGPPVALDREHPPRAVEVPVRLRLNDAAGAQVLEGHYRMRLRIDGHGWEITSAELHPRLD